jgi:hypothetical protein
MYRNSHNIKNVHTLAMSALLHLTVGRNWVMKLLEERTACAATLKMEAIYSSQMLVNAPDTTLS